MDHSNIIRWFYGELRIGSRELIRGSFTYWFAEIRTKIRAAQRTEVP